MSYFTKGRRNGITGAGRPKSQKTKDKERAEALKLQNLKKEKFEKFEKAKSGVFNGFEFVELFHEKYDKDNAIYKTTANDAANAITPFGKFHTGADGVTCYFFSKKPKKRVEFNRSIYFL